MCFVKDLWGVSIYPYRSLCLICKQLLQGPSLKNTYSSRPLYFPWILYHFPSIVCHPHIIWEMLQAPTHVLLNTGFSISLRKPKRFDHLIKVNVPTPRCLNQPINRALELAHLVSILGSTKPSGCIIYNSSLRKPLRNAVLTSIYHIS